MTNSKPNFEATGIIRKYLSLKHETFCDFQHENEEKKTDVFKDFLNCFEIE